MVNLRQYVESRYIRGSTRSDWYQFENVGPNRSVTYLWGFEGVVWREGDVQEEDTSLIDGAWRSQDGGPPLIDVVSFGAGAARAQKETRETSESVA